ncbi:transcriptional regulator, TetR family [Pseudomonas sp. ok272]|uniref:TetR/AcrR family transcriptional regulator n=1 Tax=unclassified Pseudomonas TaxID=196821 RepID=UPI0008C283D6|nr:MULTISPECIES: TetR/AcrR family transcriptional regulator [unclassified Pseudomonas]SEN00412.1 transcriptional regulator, TetR family [Pseudomonas sp. ok272]SFM88676.1 transcriptional regulator, TetR family [Pseudomonas sp. ok602]
MSKPSDDDFSVRSKSNRAPANLTVRGTERRNALLAAALRIIVKDGPGSVTFRTVVAQATASHGSVAYYFGTREELIREAMVLVANRNIRALAEMLQEFVSTPVELASLATAIARHSTQQMIEDPSMGITIIELHLAAARHPELRPVLHDWGRAYARIMHAALANLGSSDPNADAALLINTINGHVIGQLALQRSNFESTILRPAIFRVLTAISSSSDIAEPSG